MAQTLTLYRLQQTDTRLAQVGARLIAIQSILENNAELKSARLAAEKSTADLHLAQKQLQQAEYDVSQVQIKIQQTESTLYSGGVHNPKELQDLQSEIASLKRHLSVLEDRELDAMQASETAQEANEQATHLLNQAQAAAVVQNKDLATERDNLLKEQERLNIEREANLQSINAQDLALYEDIKANRRGLAVTTFSEGSCDACGSVLTQSQQQVAYHSPQLTRCPSCGRILYGK